MTEEDPAQSARPQATGNPDIAATPRETGPNKPETLRDFRMTRGWRDHLATYAMSVPESASGFIYLGGCLHIQQLDDEWYLQIGASEWKSADLGHLETVLYSWALTEGHVDIDSESDAFAFIRELQDAMPLDEFATAIERNLNEADPNVDHMHDFVDANQCMLDALHATRFDDDRIEAAWQAAMPYLGRGRPR